MPERRRRFWIMLTVIAIVFSTARWLESKNNDHSRKNYRHEFSDHSRKKSCNARAQKRHCQVKDSHRTPAIDDFVFVHKEPVAINYTEVRDNMVYSSAAREAGMEGSVIVRVLVDEHGNYQNHKIISQTHPFLGRNCDSYVNNLYFTPAVRDGKPVKFWVNIPFHFHD
ncbi:MAG: energy transducer TonB [Bacteroidia bacterium]|nr:energy transducer TonB [Bacteroidia bacterium]